MPIENFDITLLALSARTVAVNSGDQENRHARGIQVVIDVTVDPALASITPTIEGKDPLSGKYYPLLVGAAIAATGTVVLTVYPGVTVEANLAASEPLPRTWRFSMAVADTDSITYSVGASLIS